MKVSDGVKELDTFTGKLSDASRPLSMAGIAIVWLIRVPNPPIPGLEWAPFLSYPLALFILSLLLDMSQYVYYSVYWNYWYAKAKKDMKTRNLPADADPDYPPWPHLHCLGLALFYGKAVSTWIGMTFVTAWIAGRLFL